MLASRSFTGSVKSQTIDFEWVVESEFRFHFSAVSRKEREMERRVECE